MAAPDPAPSAPARARLKSFHELMQRRVQRILLISSLYDSFIMSEEGQLQETLISRFIDLKATHAPDLVTVESLEAALAALDSDRGIDLVVTSLHVAGGLAASEVVARLRAARHFQPVIALAYTSRELSEFLARSDGRGLERIFLWQGDDRILVALVQYLEDRLNVENDTGAHGVPAIIVVEDSVRFYSSFLPAIYSELNRHTHRLISEDLNLSQRILRMRARPKVLLCVGYEEAWSYFQRFEEQVLGIVSDFEFPRAGRLDPRAGLELCRRAQEARSDVRLVLQSSNPENRRLAEELGASFLLKGSPLLLSQLREVLVERFGFGDFVFRLPDRSEVDRAQDLRTLIEKLKSVPAESICYHAERNHFANWLKARTEFELAERLLPRRVGDFESVEHLRAHLLERIEETRRDRHRAVIADFDRERFEPGFGITRIGAGSLGGKARGVAFAARILRDARLERRFEGVEVYVPPAVVLGTEVFDEFLEYEWLRDFAVAQNPDREIVRRFLEAPFPRRAIAALETYLGAVRHPLAVRSSSLLEDSLSQPFAGVYQTFMLQNNELEQEARWRQLAAAVKRVWASTFSEQAKTYLSMTAYRLEEEKMAVMVQELVGLAHQERFYPDFSGVARSHNFYPEPGQSAADGVAAVALGMGQTVVGGERCLRFCPRHPRQIVGFSSVADALANAQREFYALDLSREAHEAGFARLRRHPLECAEQDGTLSSLGSTYCAEDQRISDGIARKGERLVSFAQVLKHQAFPLAPILVELLERCSQGTGAAVELEFAGLLPRPGRPGRFAFLQMRPLALSQEHEEVRIDPVPAERLLCQSRKILGNGRIADLRDLVVVDPHTFERKRSLEVAREVARLDARLRAERRPYLLVGPGRWGSSDPSLGIPVGWSQICGARVIVEAGLRDIRVAPSQGTHFFQNLAACSVGYLTVNPEAGDGWLDWSWLGQLPALEASAEVRHLRIAEPLEIRLNGRTGEGVAIKPALATAPGGG